MSARFPAPVQTGPGAHPASCTMGTGSFPGVKSGRGVTLTPHHLLVPWSRKSRAIPLLPLWAYSLYRASVPVQGCTLPLPLPCDAEMSLLESHVTEEAMTELITINFKINIVLRDLQ